MNKYIDNQHANRERRLLLRWERLGELHHTLRQPKRIFLNKLYRQTNR